MWRPIENLLDSYSIHLIIYQSLLFMPFATLYDNSTMILTIKEETESPMKNVKLLFNVANF